MNSNQVSILECARPLLFLNLHRLQREPNIAGWMSGRHYAAEGRMSVESTHLAAARRQWEGNGISGTVKMEPYTGSFLLVFISNITREVRDNECF